MARPVAERGGGGIGLPDFEVGEPLPGVGVGATATLLMTFLMTFLTTFLTTGAVA